MPQQQQEAGRSSFGPGPRITEARLGKWHCVPCKCQRDKSRTSQQMHRTEPANVGQQHGQKRAPQQQQQQDEQHELEQVKVRQTDVLD